MKYTFKTKCITALASLSLVTSTQASMVSDVLADTLLQYPEYSNGVLYNGALMQRVDFAAVTNIKHALGQGNRALLSEQLDALLHHDLTLQELGDNLATFGIEVQVPAVASVPAAPAQPMGKYIGSETGKGSYVAAPVSQPTTIATEALSTTPATVVHTEPPVRPILSSRPAATRTAKVTKKHKKKGGNGMLYTLGGLAVLGGLGAAAGGGGGGGGGGSSTAALNNGSSFENGSFNWSDPRTNFYNNTASPASFVTTEFTASQNNILGAVNAQYAYAMGLTGAGVRIGILDWFNPTLSSFDQIVDNVNLAYSYTVNHPQGFHGNTVAAYAAATKDGSGLHGVAYNAELVLEQVGSASYSIQQLVNQVDVMNVSLDSGALSDAAINAIGNSDTVVVAAAGNYGSGVNTFDPNNSYYQAPITTPVEPAIYAADDRTNGNLIVAGAAADLNGQWVSASYEAGATQHNYIVVPANNFVETTFNGETVYSYASTSYATPIVAGAAALIRQGWGGLSASDVAQILLLSATDIGAPGVDAVFGHGMLNIQAALQPIGAASVPAANRQAGETEASTSNVALSSAFGDALSNTNTHVGIVDQFDRAYQVGLEHFVSAKPQVETIDDQFAAFGGGSEWVENKVNDSISVAFQPTKAASVTAGNQEGARKGLAITDAGDHTAKYRAAISFGGSHDTDGNLQKNTALYASQSGNAQEALAWAEGDIAGQQDSLISRNSMAVPYLALHDTSKSYGAGMKTQVNDKLAVGVSTLFNEDEDGEEDTMLSMVRADYKTNEMLTFSATQGMLVEKHSFLGSNTEGAFDTKDGVTTLFAGVRANADITEKVSLQAQAYVGNSMVDPAKQSIFTDVSNVVTTSYGVGMQVKDVMKQGDQLNIAVERPLRVVHGEAKGRVVTGNDNVDHSLQTAAFKSDLTPSKQAVNIEAAYHTTLGKEGKLSMGAQYMINPNHSDAEDAFTVMMKYKKSF